MRILAAILVALLPSALAGCQTTAIESATAEGQPAETIAAREWRPDGAGPFPAVVLLHGCAGWHGENIDTWARWFVARGYVAMAVDSFGPRGVESICSGSGQVGRIQRGRDAYGALETLAARPDVDPERILVMGFSNGGSVTLTVLSGSFHDAIVPKAPYFRAGIAMYPNCATIAQPRYAPLLIVIGEKDDWTFARVCEPAPLHLSGGRPTELLVIPGAYHSFDNFAWKGRPVGYRTVLGHELRPDRAATEAAKARVERFLGTL